MSELGFVELLFKPLGMLLIAGLSLFTFNNLLRAVATAASAAFAKAGAWQKAINPYAVSVKPVVDLIYGKPAASVELMPLLLVAILIVLCGIWRSVENNNKLLAAANRSAKTVTAAPGSASAATKASAAK